MNAEICVKLMDNIERGEEEKSKVIPINTNNNNSDVKVRALQIRLWCVIIAYEIQSQL